MAAGSRPLDVLVLQVRDHGPARDQECECFHRSVGELGEVRFRNLLSREPVRWREVDDADVLMIGGAGAHTVTETYDFTASLAEAVRRWVTEERPFFGSCWGHHFLAYALGGSVVTDDDAEEVGTFEIALTETGRRDPLLQGFPPRFTGQLGHHDRIDRLPEGAVELAVSDRCGNQMLRIADLPVYSTQFHPEMTADDLSERLGMYADEYLEGEAAELPTIEPSVDASTLIPRFLASLRR